MVLLLNFTVAPGFSWHAWYHVTRATIKVSSTELYEAPRVRSPIPHPATDFESTFTPFLIPIHDPMGCAYSE